MPKVDLDAATMLEYGPPITLTLERRYVKRAWHKGACVGRAILKLNDYGYHVKGLVLPADAATMRYSLRVALCVKLKVRFGDAPPVARCVEKLKATR